MKNQREPFRVISHLAINLANSGCELPVIIMISDDDGSSMVANFLYHTQKNERNSGQANLIKLAKMSAG